MTVERCVNYIKNIFYGISKNKNGKDISEYEKYKPWGKEDFSGKLKYELDDGQVFEIYRDFNKKNPIIFNDKLEDVSKEFDIVKKDGVQYIYNQTGVDETMFTSTVVSMQAEVKLDKQEQNTLVQKLANLAGTGDDKVSFKKVIDTLNKKQLEEIGTDRTQEKPINIIKNRMKEIEFVLKELNTYQKDKENINEKKLSFSKKIEYLGTKIDLLKDVNIILLRKQQEEEKINIKENYKNEKNKKIDELNSQKNDLIKKINEINFKKNNLNKKNNIKKYILILFFILLINILIYIFNKNKLINIFNYFLIPIYLIIIFILQKNKKIKINKKIKLENEKINNEINLLNKQIELLNEEKNKIEEEIKNEEINLDNNFEIEIEKIKRKNIKNNYLEKNNEINKLNINELLDEAENNNINDIINNTQKDLTENRLALQKIKIDEENILNKLENIINLKEEYEGLKEQLENLDEKNKSINLAKELLTKAYDNMKNNITPKFTENLSKNIANISNNKYTKVGINDEKGLIVENELGQYIEAERLSIGTIDQLYLSLRLSMIDEISKEKMPIMLDEAFAYYDDTRLENILKYLANSLNEHQLIIFTCTKREEKILDKLHITYNIVEL